jgi:hypothetical protein
MEDPVFMKFQERRRQLNERLDETRAPIDMWFNQHQGQRPSIAALATLEGLLAQRQEVFKDFIVAHEEFITRAIRPIT